jgi:uncharacterized protein (DUF58 family)
VLRPTRAGWCFFTVIFGVGFAALNTGNNLLYLVLSLMLGFLALSGVLSESALRGIEVRRRIPRELFAGMANPVLLEIANHQRRVPAFAVVVEDRMVEAPGRREWDPPRTAAAGRAFGLRIEAGGCELRRYRFQPRRRGIVEFSGFRVSTRFPFGLFLKFKEIPAPEAAVVFPALERVSVAPQQAGELEHGARTSTELGEGTLVAGLREFAPGDSLRRVHWRTSLRRSQLLVRELERERDAEIEVLLRTRGAERGEDFERRVRWAASEAVAHLEQGMRVALRTDGDRVPGGAGAAQRVRLLSFLALVEPDPKPREADARRRAS